MTDLEINKAIHKMMGECSMPTVDSDSTWEKFDEDGICRECNRGIGDHTRIPKYTSDLNAVHRAEMKAIERLSTTNNNPNVTYCRHLMVANGFDYNDLGYLYEQVIRATARQRAEAVLRATGNWEDK